MLPFCYRYDWDDHVQVLRWKYSARIFRLGQVRIFQTKKTQYLYKLRVDFTDAFSRLPRHGVARCQSDPVSVPVRSPHNTFKHDLHRGWSSGTRSRVLQTGHASRTALFTSGWNSMWYPEIRQRTTPSPRSFNPLLLTFPAHIPVHCSQFQLWGLCCYQMENLASISCLLTGNSTVMPSQSSLC